MHNALLSFKVYLKVFMCTVLHFDFDDEEYKYTISGVSLIC